MAETAANRAAEAYYTTARALGTGTTSTATMEIWQLLSEHLVQYGKPMSGSELSQATGLSIEQIEHIFSQTYYQKHYGFRRFDTYEAWEQWALSEGVLYNPELHDPKPVAEPAGEAEAEEPEDAE
ncbi:MAG: hypothetical protein ACOY93_23245 [Bacillota bacterium]